MTVVPAAFQKITMNLAEVFSYKLSSFLNAGPEPDRFGPLVYAQAEPSQFLLAAGNVNDAAVPLVRWHDLFAMDGLARAMRKHGYSEADLDAVVVILSRFALLFEVDRRQRTNKDYFVFFYVLQLLALKRRPVERGDDIRNKMLYFLLFELSIDHDARARLRLSGNRMMFAVDELVEVDFLQVIDEVYGSPDIERGEEHALISCMHGFHRAVVTFLAAPGDAELRLNFDDRNADLIESDRFLDALTRDPGRVFEALAGAVDRHQSSDRLFVSNMILMNYSFHVLKDRPGDVLNLRRHLGNDALFGEVLRALIHRRMFVDKARFAAMDTGQDLSDVVVDSGLFYNITHSELIV